MSFEQCKPTAITPSSKAQNHTDHEDLKLRIVVLMLAGCRLTCWERTLYFCHRAEIDAEVEFGLRLGEMAGETLDKKGRT